MKRIAFFAFMAGVLCSCGAPKFVSKKIHLNPKEPSTFVHQNLKKFISQNPGASVVVRDPYGGIGAVSGTSETSRVCMLIERGLMMKGYNPRDRALFENTIQKMKEGGDYVEIHKQTGTDLIFEVTQFSKDPYVESTYTDQHGREYPFSVQVSKKLSMPYSYVLYGFSIEIKVILLQENLIAGVFRYYQVPCTNGCNVEYYDANGMRYQLPNSSQTYFASETSKQGTTGVSDKAVADFISEIVIPAMFSEMGDSSAQTNITVRSMPREITNQSASSNVSNIEGTTFVANNNTATNGQDCATLYFYANQVSPLTAVTYNVHLGDEQIGRVKSSWIETRKVCDFGPHVIWGKTESKIEIPINIEPGREYYIRCGYTMFGALVARPKIELMDNNIGQREFNSIKKPKSDSKKPVDNTPKTSLLQDQQVETSSNINSQSSNINSQPSNINSHEMSNVLPGLIARLSAEQESKTVTPDPKSKKSKGTPASAPKEYKTDEERFLSLNMEARMQIEKFIASNLSKVTNTPPATKDDVVMFCKERKLSRDEQKSGNDPALIVFLDGEVIGAGTASKGVFTTFPKEKYDATLHNLSIKACSKFDVLGATPVDFSIKNYFVFAWVDELKVKLTN